jgi:phosphatidylglycerophosphate synthase
MGMRSTGNEILDQELGHQLQQRADLLTDVRKYGGVAAGLALGYFGPSWPLTGVVAGLEYTDRQDGLDARDTAELLRRVPTHAGSDKDHWADKWFQYALMAGMTLHEIKEKHYKQAGFIAANMAAIGIRDGAMAEVRRHAHSRGKDVKAQGLNKIKTGVLMGADLVATTPWADKPNGKKARNVLLGLGTALAWTSYAKFKRNLED